jgi:hypothetical protein
LVIVYVSIILILCFKTRKLERQRKRRESGEGKVGFASEPLSSSEIKVNKGEEDD